MPTYYTQIDSPIGTLTLASDGEALTSIQFPSGKHAVRIAPDWVADATVTPLPEAARQLAEYFAGTRREFDLPLRAEGTGFQRQVWDELCRIPYGATASYGDVARRIGQPNASRAVGAANGRNPIPIVVPCHRVIGAGGQLTGFGGGLETKQRLLRLEQMQQSGETAAALPLDF